MRQFVQYALRSLAIFVVAGTMFAARLEPTGNSVAGEVLVKLRKGASQSDIAAVNRQFT